MQRVRAASFALGLGFAAALFPACSKSSDTTVLQDKDFQKPEGFDGEFDRNNVLEDANFTDSEGLDIVLVRKFLHDTPYDRASFLETYQSNGIQAADAITRAARTYHLNPLVFLVYAEVAQGLIGAADYPFPPDRVEYVFRCGCLAANNCLPELAGFDRQLDCLGRSIRKALDDAAANGETDSGWGKEVTSTTLDGLKVSPGGNATAAIYDHTPIIAEGKAGGVWLFWNVWQVYAFGIDYAGPIGGATGGGWIGAACKSDDSCGGFPSATCATNYPEGLCTTSCTGDCPSAANESETFCVDFGGEGGFCFEICNPSAPSCRDGYKCVNLPRYKSTSINDAKHVCFPDTAKP